MKTKQLDIQFKASDIKADGTFSGYASVFDVKDSYGDVVVKGAFVKSLADHKEKGTMPALLWQHKRDEPIGVWTEMREDDTGLYCEGKLLIDDDLLAKRAYAHLKAGSLSGLSIGFILKDYESGKDGIWFLTEIDLKETSIVTFPANDAARVDNVKQGFAEGEIPSKREIEQILRDAGFSRQDAKAFISVGYAGLEQRDADESTVKKLEKLIETIGA